MLFHLLPLVKSLVMYVPSELTSWNEGKNEANARIATTRWWIMRNDEKNAFFASNISNFGAHFACFDRLHSVIGINSHELLLIIIVRENPRAPQASAHCVAATYSISSERFEFLSRIGRPLCASTNPSRASIHTQLTIFGWLNTESNCHMSLVGILRSLSHSRSIRCAFVTNPSPRCDIYAQSQTGKMSMQPLDWLEKYVKRRMKLASQRHIRMPFVCMPSCYGRRMRRWACCYAAKLKHFALECRRQLFTVSN